MFNLRFNLRAEQISPTETYNTIKRTNLNIHSYKIASFPQKNPIFYHNARWIDSFIFNTHWMHSKCSLNTYYQYTYYQFIYIFYIFKTMRFQNSDILRNYFTFIMYNVDITIWSTIEYKMVREFFCVHRAWWIGKINRWEKFPRFIFRISRVHKNSWDHMAFSFFLHIRKAIRLTWSVTWKFYVKRNAMSNKLRRTLIKRN